MSHRCLVSMDLLAGLIAALSLMLAPVAGQAPSSVSKTWTTPRVPWGEPDLQGIWTNATLTPLERPSASAAKEVLTDEEAAALEKQAQRPVDGASRPGDPGSYNAFWLERGTRVIGTRRPSLIVDPPDGRIPPLTPEGRSRADAWAVRGADSWESRSLYERCITRGLPASMIPGFYNHNYQIVQAPGYVVILVEMIHDARIVPLDGRPHIEPTIRQWMGDPRGHWEGNTLVVDSTNFSEKSSQYTGGTGDSSTSYRGSADGLRVVERFTRVDVDAIDYQFTVDDPTTFTRPWTASIPMTKSQGPLYEYACHEGNYSMLGILRGARAEEKAVDEAVKKR
jgi:hypothetical protein